MRLAVAHTIAELRAKVARWRGAGDGVALIPTMGALHEGHLALVRRGQRQAGRTVVSIFVNPTQFAPTEDFTTYPRTFETDCAMLAEIGADLVYAPAPATMYPDGFTTTISLEGPAKAGLEDAARPHFFAGVATVVAKLLTQCGPDLAIFGEKDFQQLRVVTRLAQDLDLPVDIVGVETVRDPDGLAMSSRNRLLSGSERGRAAALPEVLRTSAEALRTGGTLADILAAARAALAQAGFAVDYFEARDAASLARVSAIGTGPVRLLAAARLGSTRLIDNWPV